MDCMFWAYLVQVLILEPIPRQEEWVLKAKNEVIVFSTKPVAMSSLWKHSSHPPLPTFFLRGS